MTTVPQTPSIIRIPDAGGAWEFPGVLLGGVSTQINDNPRWSEISLYKHADGRYVLHTCGASVVYHKNNGPCNTGVPTTAEEMPLDVEPCKICKPGIVPPRIDPGTEDLYPEDDDFWEGKTPSMPLWDMEQDRYTTYVCKTAAEVVDRLRKPRSRKNDEGGTFSAPAQRLLDIVVPKDSDIAQVVNAVRKL